jgi:hypothetical protein
MKQIFELELELELELEPELLNPHVSSSTKKYNPKARGYTFIF